MSIHIVVHQMGEDDPSQGLPILPFVLEATPEMTWQRTLKQAYDALVSETEGTARLEVCAWDEDKLIGWASVMDDDDPNVGQCVSIHSFYVLPEYRGVGQRIFRTIIKTCTEYGYKVLGYSQRVSEGRYEIRYMRINKT